MDQSANMSRTEGLTVPIALLNILKFYGFKHSIEIK